MSETEEQFQSCLREVEKSRREGLEREGVERIVVCAANRMPDGHLLIGARHWDKLMCQQADKLGYKGGNEEQGFIDQFGDFMSRDEALEVASKNGQRLKRPIDTYETLYSENLY